jgi:phosphoesterase RecJ-like protein
MEISQNIAHAIFSTCKNARRIVIISHRNPDADSIGSNLALRQLLEAMGKEVVSACVDPVPGELLFLRGADTFQQSFDINETDLIICVDAGSTAQTSFLERQPELLRSGKPVINIDHHPSNNGYGTVNLVVNDAASTTLVILNLFKTLKIRMNPSVATCLLCGLYYDTGSFMHSNTGEEVYQAASELMAGGADMETIVKNMYKNRSISQLKTWGRILDNMKLTPNNIVVSGITRKELEACSASTAETSGIIDYLSTVKDAEFATLLVEDEKGNIRGSFRTRKNDINLSEMAGMFGGGGHKKASGFNLPGILRKETVWTVESE